METMTIVITPEPIDAILLYALTGVGSIVNNHYGKTYYSIIY